MFKILVTLVDPLGEFCSNDSCSGSRQHYIWIRGLKSNNNALFLKLKTVHFYVVTTATRTHWIFKSISSKAIFYPLRVNLQFGWYLPDNLELISRQSSHSAIDGKNNLHSQSLLLHLLLKSSTYFNFWLYHSLIVWP